MRIVSGMFAQAMTEISPESLAARRAPALSACHRSRNAFSALNLRYVGGRRLK